MVRVKLSPLVICAVLSSDRLLDINVKGSLIKIFQACLFTDGLGFTLIFYAKKSLCNMATVINHFYMTLTVDSQDVNMTINKTRQGYAKVSSNWWVTLF